MAKVITALAIMEKRPFEPGQTGQTYTLTDEDVAIYRAYVAKDGSVLPVYAGMKLTQYQALQMMLIASANNIADTMVARIFGSREAYTLYAQAMVQRMGLSRTVIADASGFSPNTVSTPSELVAIGIAALKNPVITEIVSQPQALIPGVGVITNTNELLGTDGVVGIKTGTTNQAGSCLLFAARSATVEAGKKVTIVGVILGGTSAVSLYSDSRELLESARQAFNLVETQPTGNAVEPPSKHKIRAPGAIKQ
jgi:D-alanyl-D-alanine carboxypeptidase (penicillin-binding protein 5/6)